MLTSYILLQNRYAFSSRQTLEGYRLCCLVVPKMPYCSICITRKMNFLLLHLPDDPHGRFNQVGGRVPAHAICTDCAARLVEQRCPFCVNVDLMDHPIGIVEENNVCGQAFVQRIADIVAPNNQPSRQYIANFCGGLKRAEADFCHTHHAETRHGRIDRAEPEVVQNDVHIAQPAGRTVREIYTGTLARTARMYALDTFVVPYPVVDDIQRHADTTLTDIGLYDSDEDFEGAIATNILEDQRSVRTYLRNQRPR